MIGNLIQNQFTTARDWPFGSAVSLVLMAIVMVLLFVIARGEGEELAVKPGSGLAIYAVGAYLFLHLPLLILAHLQLQLFAIHGVGRLLAALVLRPRCMTRN